MDALQRFGRVKFEATSFTISEPTEDLEISSLIYDLANPKQKEILENIYDIKPFFIKAMTIERIFIDKLFAAEAYYRKCNIPTKAFDSANHIYDITVFFEIEKIQSLINDENKLNYLLQFRLREEIERLDGIPYVNPIDFTFFDNTKESKPIATAYKIMQQQYVLRNQDRIDFEKVISTLKQLKEILLNNSSWCDCKSINYQQSKKSGLDHFIYYL